jgi:hypothetical protein
MDKIVLLNGFMIIMLLAGSACAVSCNSYFAKSDDKRVRVVSDANALDLTTSRVSSAVEDLYDEVRDLHAVENLSSVSDYLDDLSNKQSDVSDDMRSISEDIDTYENAVSDARNDLPNQCFKMFDMYDSDVSDVKDWTRNVKKEWDRFASKYTVIAGYRSNPSNVNASYALPKINDIRDYADNLDSSAGGGITFGVNATEFNNGTTYNTSECFGMITKNVEIALKDCNTKCNTFLNQQLKNCTGVVSATTTTLPAAQPNKTCPVCQTCQTCPSCPAQGDLSNQLQICETKAGSLQALLDQKESNMGGNCTVNKEQNTLLTSQNQDLRASNDNLTAQNAKLVKELSGAKSSVCQDCTIYIIAIFILAGVILAAWLFVL